MRLRIISSVIVLFVGVLAVMAWNRNTTRNAPSAGAPGEPGEPSGRAEVPMGGESAVPTQDPGVEWRKPERWVAELASGMRLATYAVPAPGSGGEGAKCAVYYFGPGQGGGTEANIERWIGEFEEPRKPTRRAFEVKGLKISWVEVTGTYLAHAGAPEGTESASSGWTLLGAIVEGPRGALFFKLTGPAQVVAPAAEEFDGLLGSLRRR